MSLTWGIFPGPGSRHVSDIFPFSVLPRLYNRPGESYDEDRTPLRGYPAVHRTPAIGTYKN